MRLSTVAQNLKEMLICIYVSTFPKGGEVTKQKLSEEL